MEMARLERLAKVLAQTGTASRRKCEVLIREGRVYVGGIQIRDPAFPVDPFRDDIRLDGERLWLEKSVTYLLNKPKGLLCTHRDVKGRCTVYDLFRGHSQRLFTVGRLDKDSQGLILLTNNGKLSNLLAHPRHRVPKTYRVEVKGRVTQNALEKARAGVCLREGKLSLQRVILKRGKERHASSVLEITLTEGKNREVRRVLARLGFKVKSLNRISLGPLELGDLPVGKYRRLTPREEEILSSLMEKKGDS